MSSYDTWTSPLQGRYASKEMLQIWSARHRYSIWRKLWLWLAESEKQLGLAEITDEAIAQMKAHLNITDEEFELVKVEEAKVRHDVMAHVHVFGKTCPAAAGIIHLGATSCFVTDNADLIIMRDALDLLLPKLATVIRKLQKFALANYDLPCLSYTHYQPAITTSVGKRACVWLQNLVMDLEELEHLRSRMRARSAKGTTGTQASFLELFNDDHEKVEELDRLVTVKSGFESSWVISTQTYSRKVDYNILNAIASFGTTAYQFAQDIRLLSHDGELAEPHEKSQIGSSAMAFKQNPMRCERICSLARLLPNYAHSLGETFMTQMLERSLDDSAGRRVALPESFLIADAILLVLDNVISGLAVYPNVISARLQKQLPFMATEKIIMRMVQEYNADRQECHEHIRVASIDATQNVLEKGGENDMVERIQNDPYFKPILGELDGLLDPQKFLGRAHKQVLKYCGEGGEVEKALEKYKHAIDASKTVELKI